jgi:hypothetical protein
MGEVQQRVPASKNQEEMIRRGKWRRLFFSTSGSI